MALGLIFVVILILLLSVFIFHPYFFKAFRMTVMRGQRTAGPYDLHDFNHRTISNGPVQTWSHDRRFNPLRFRDEFSRQLLEMKTSAFLISRNGELIHEQYFGNHHPETLSNSFSMAKSVVALMTGKAVEEGYIHSLDQKVSEFFPQYKYSPANQLSIRDLIRMSSGMDWREEYYLPFNVTTKAYYGRNLKKLILDRKIKAMPGREFEYQSGNTQLLGLILKKVVPSDLSTYLSDKFWIPMGMESPGYWTIDEASGIEKTYCCIHATARDFMKFGQLFLQNGEWNGQQIVSCSYIDEMRGAGFSSSPQYGAGLWLDLEYDPPFYLMRGHLGQYVIVIPTLDTVICRLGRKYKKENKSPRLEPSDIYTYVDGVMDALEKAGQSSDPGPPKL